MSELILVVFLIIFLIGTIIYRRARKHLLVHELSRLKEFRKSILPYFFISYIIMIIFCGIIENYEIFSRDYTNVMLWFIPPIFIIISLTTINIKLNNLNLPEAYKKSSKKAQKVQYLSVALLVGYIVFMFF